MDLKAAAQNANLTGQQIALRLGLTPSTVSRWMTGQAVVPAEHIRDLANILGVDPVEILPEPTKTIGETRDEPTKKGALNAENGNRTE